MPEKLIHDFVLDEDEHGEFCIIPISGLKYFAKIDVEEFEDIAQYKWHIVKKKNKKNGYAVRQIRINGKRKKEYMHRRILGITDGVLADHINGDILDNRIQNLRVANRNQNQWNSKPRHGTSQYKGVYWHKHNRLWYATLQYYNQRIYIKQFNKEIVSGVDVGEIKAAKAYDEAAKKYYGNFARLNFPEEGVEPVAYKMKKSETKKAAKLIRTCSFETLAEIGSAISTKSVGEIELMCRFCECNISLLAQRIRGLNLPKQMTEERKEQARLSKTAS
jgi:hypothetical protein